MAHDTNTVHLGETESGAAEAPVAISHDETPSLPAVAGFEPVAVVPRRDGWTPERQRAFIEALADCGLVCEAAARVGMSEQTARRLRRRPDAAGFSRAWDQAIRAGAERPRSVAWERAVNGTPRQRYYRGKVVGEERVFDNRLLIYLLGRSAVNRPTCGPGEAHGAPLGRGKNGVRSTSFPPPPGLDGRELGRWGEQGNRRTLIEDEEAKLSALREDKLAEDERQRDRYFARLRSEALQRGQRFASRTPR